MGWVVEGEPAHGESARILTYLERGHAFGTLDVGVFQLSFHRLPAVRVDVAIDPQHMQVESGRLTPRGLVAFLHKPARGRRHREEDDEASRRGPGERGPGATGATEAEGATGAEGAVGRVRPREGSGEASKRHDCGANGGRDFRRAQPRGREPRPRPNTTQRKFTVGPSPSPTRSNSSRCRRRRDPADHSGDVVNAP